MTLQRTVPDCVLGRLPHYLRAIEKLPDRQPAQAITSREIADASGQTAALVRRDLRSLGHLGKRGTGYPPDRLRAVIGRQLGLERSWRIVVVGTAFLSASELALIAGSENFAVLWTVDDLEALEAKLDIGLDVESPIDIAVIATSEADAQAAADLLCEAGVQLLLNCSPAELHLPPSVRVAVVNPLGALRSLTYKASSRTQDGESDAPSSWMTSMSAGRDTTYQAFSRRTALLPSKLTG